MREARRAAAWAGRGIVALDIAGDEAIGAFATLAPAVRVAREAGLAIDTHAGETGGARAMREALALLAPDRIAHGVGVVQEPELVSELRDRGLHLAMAITSNVQTGAVPEPGAPSLRRAAPRRRERRPEHGQPHDLGDDAVRRVRAGGRRARADLGGAGACHDAGGGGHVRPRRGPTTAGASGERGVGSLGAGGVGKRHADRAHRLERGVRRAAGDAGHGDRQPGVGSRRRLRRVRRAPGVSRARRVTVR